MPALFARSLCGYRSSNGNPNTSDNSDKQSIRLGHELFHQLGVPAGQEGPRDQGAALEDEIVEALRQVRPDLRIRRSRPATDFTQYAHLDVFPSFRRSYMGSTIALGKLGQAIGDLPVGLERSRLERVFGEVSEELASDAGIVDRLRQEMPEESLLKIDISVAIPRADDLEELAIALSVKWSLRTDRAQDCVSQGSKLVGQRRGRMPHFAVVTLEPRPAMLKIIADGSGAVDCVYHVDLQALDAAICAEARRDRSPETWSPKRTFDRLAGQRRLRDFDELIRQVEQLPRP